MVETSTITQMDNQDLINDDPLIKRHFAIQQLQSGELSWKEYMNSLTPEEQEEEQNYARERARKWWNANKDMANARRREKVNCGICGMSLSRRSVLEHHRRKHKSPKIQDA